MADEDEKTEEPTDKKIEDAKKEGNVNKSAEVTGAAILTLGSMYLLFFSSYSMSEIKKMMMFTYGFIGEDMDSSVYYSLTYTVVTTFLSALAPLFALIMVLVFATNWMQFGFLVTPLKFDLQKLDPIKGFGNIFGLKKVIEALKLTAKLTIIVVVMFLLFLFTHKAFLSMMDLETSASIAAMIQMTFYFLAAILFIIIIFAIMDFYFTRHYYMKSLRMSKQDIKDEFKNMDGDPQVKGRIRRIQMEMSRKRMMSDVPDADVVITNPTHYAIALKYDKEVDTAPKMIAKGIDFIAVKIKDIAKKNNIPIIENPALARSLYDQIELEQQIPSEFYKALAEIFSYVYELKKKR
ncbi:MAG: flagellar biosynthesis protein FlhB [Arcobacter sp.]|nr:flagellar biosynthesis protein FlhB [Arcobacter sp.]|tara:strand:- start:11573 stop:12622 length:1050 start_codon:yes stop_codon:yes gene_type:complete